MSKDVKKKPEQKKPEDTVQQRKAKQNIILPGIGEDTGEDYLYYLEFEIISEGAKAFGKVQINKAAYDEVIPQIKRKHDRIVITKLDGELKIFNNTPPITSVEMVKIRNPKGIWTPQGSKGGLVDSKGKVIELEGLN